MKKLFAKLPSDIKDASTLAFGNGFALAIPVLLSPLLTRIYSADHFGTLTIYLALIGFIGAFATGRLDFAILISNSKKNAAHLFKIAVFFAMVVSGISFITLFFTAGLIIEVFNAPGLANIIYLIPLNIFLYAIISATQNALNREKEYRGISISKSIRSLFVGVSQLCFGLVGFNQSGLIIGKLIGDVFSGGYLGFQVQRLGVYLSQKFTLKRGIVLFKQNDKYLKYNAPHATVTALSTSSTALLLGYFFGDKIVGYYGLSFMVCIAPVTIISTAFYPVFSQKVSEMFNSGIEIRSYTKKSIQVLALISFIPFILLMIFGPDIFSAIFGEEWKTSGDFVQILAPYLFLIFILSPLTYIPLIYDRHRTSFMFEIFATVSRITGLIIGGVLGDIFIALILFVGVSIIVQTANLFWISRLTLRGHA